MRQNTGAHAEPGSCLDCAEKIGIGSTKRSKRQAIRARVHSSCPWRIATFGRNALVLRC